MAGLGPLPDLRLGTSEGGRKIIFVLSLLFMIGFGHFKYYILNHGDRGLVMH